MSWLTNLFKRKETIADLAADKVEGRRAWMPEEVTFITKNFRKLGAVEVAWQLGRTADSVRGKAKSLGL